MPQTDYSANYLLYNAESSKNLVIAIEIEGLSTVLTSTDLFKRIRYGDPGLTYGDGHVYGGLTAYGDYRALLDLSGGSLTLSQRLEPEQGRGAISTLSLSFIDKDQFMTQLISPGVLLDDILGKQVKVYLGYQQIAYPEDFTVIFRGRVSAYEAMSGRITLQLSDPNMVRRQQIFYMGVTNLSASAASGDTTIYVDSAGDFFQQITGPDGTYDPAITTYVKIENEIIEYPATGWSATALSGCTRGARGTIAAAHDINTEVDAAIQVEDHCIDMALKLMLSGWNGPYLSGLPIQNFVFAGGDVASNAGLMLLDSNKAADRDYGIAVGDYLTITGAAVSGNNTTCQVLEFVDVGGSPANAIITDATFTLETASSAVFSVRSQYDTYPISCGVKLPGTDVDVAQHIYIKDTFMGSDENKMRFYLDTAEDSCKTFIENQIYLPSACYSITRFGRCSIQLTHAPLADQRLQFLNGTNVLEPQNIKPSRGVNNRKFFNQVNWTYDYLDDGTPASTLKALDSDSITIIGYSSILPIDAKGIRSAFGSQTVIDRRTNYLLSRYKNGAVLIDIKVNWAVGCLIESGDVVAVQDDDVLQISNFVTGQRNLGTQLFEVINRSLDMKNANVKLTLVSGLGAQVTDRYGVISPSSIIQTGSTTGTLIISDSYGALYPHQEIRKWENYEGIRILVHDENYTISSTATFTSVNTSFSNAMNVSGLSIAASALPGLIIDIDDYSTSTDPNDQLVVKAIHVYQDAEVTIVSGISPSAFTVASADIDKFEVGFPISVHNEDFSVAATETLVSNVDTGTYTVTVAANLGFTPSAGDLCDLLGFLDGTAGYRLL